MYMRVTRARIDQATLDGEAGTVGPGLAAAIRRLPGYQSFTSGVESASGQAITVSTWDTEEYARYSTDALGDIPSRLQALRVKPDPPQIFEVTTQPNAGGGAPHNEAPSPKKGDGAVF